MNQLVVYMKNLGALQCTFSLSLFSVKDVTLDLSVCTLREVTQLGQSLLALTEIWKDQQIISCRLTSVSGHVTENFQMPSILRWVDEILSVSFGSTYVPDFLTRPEH